MVKTGVIRNWYYIDTYFNILILCLIYPPTTQKNCPKFDGYKDLCLKQNSKSYAIQYEYKSPTQQAGRWYNMQTFNYTDNINKKMLNNVLRQLDINGGKVAQNKRA